MTLFSSHSSQTVALTMVDGCFVEETSILFSFLEPFHSGFLALVYLLLMFTLDEFLEHKAFLLSDLRQETKLHALILNLFDFTINLQFHQENITKRFFVPLFYVCFEYF